jgi:hypothetical protein
MVWIECNNEEKILVKDAIILTCTKSSCNHCLIFWTLDCKKIIIINRFLKKKCYCEYIVYVI